MRVLRGPVQVSITALDAAVQWENLGQPHIALAAEPIWRDDEARREYFDEGLAEFRRCGLGGPRGLDADFRDTVVALARPEFEFCGLLAVDERKVNVLAVSQGREAVLAISDMHSITLQPIRPDALAEAVIGQLPRVPAARARAVNVPESDYKPETAPRRPRREEEGFGGLARAEQMENPDVGHLRRIVDLPTTGGGHLYAAIRLHSGRRQQCATPLGYIDTAEGRFLTQTTAGRTGERWLVAAPASPELLVNRLYEMQRALA